MTATNLMFAWLLKDQRPLYNTIHVWPLTSILRLYIYYYAPLDLNLANNKQARHTHTHTHTHIL